MSGVPKMLLCPIKTFRLSKKKEAHIWIQHNNLEQGKQLPENFLWNKGTFLCDTQYVIFKLTCTFHGLPKFHTCSWYLGKLLFYLQPI